MAEPCKTCGTCPTCGSRPAQVIYVYPNTYIYPNAFQPWPQPWWQTYEAWNANGNSLSWFGSGQIFNG